jgi:hypothetical protein
MGAICSLVGQRGVRVFTVPEFIDPVLAVKTSILVQTSLKRLFSFQTLLRDISFSLLGK